MKEFNTLQRITITVAFIIIILLFIFFISLFNNATNPNAPKFSKADRSRWYEKISNTTWVIDENSKATRLKEFSYNIISSISFSYYDGINPLTLTLNSTTFKFFGTLEEGENTFTLRLDDEAELELWYSESESETYPVVTIKGESEKIFFVKPK